jgi:CIC family chloride channel protein
MTVAEVMQTEASALRESDSLATATNALMRTRSHGLPVLNQDGELVGILTLQDLDRAQTQGADTVHTVGQVCTRDLLVAYPEETIGAALKRMSARDVGRLPVVARDRPRHLLGMLRRNDVVRAYDVALARRTAMRHRAHQVRLGAHVANGVNVEEVTVEADAPCVGQRISQIAWPCDCVIATLRRGQYVLIPHGDTVLKAGDVLVAVVEGEASVGLQRVCMAAKDAQQTALSRG